MHEQMVKNVNCQAPLKKIGVHVEIVANHNHVFPRSLCKCRFVNETKKSYSFNWFIYVRFNCRIINGLIINNNLFASHIKSPACQPGNKYQFCGTSQKSIAVLTVHGTCEDTFEKLFHVFYSLVLLPVY